MLANIDNNSDCHDHYYYDFFIIGHYYDAFQVTTEAALGLIGGTMGLLTGFSILSGVETKTLKIYMFFCSFSVQSRVEAKSLKVFTAYSTFTPQVEIIYFLLKFLLSLRVSRHMMSCVNKLLQKYFIKND